MKPDLSNGKASVLAAVITLNAYYYHYGLRGSKENSKRLSSFIFIILIYIFIAKRSIFRFFLRNLLIKIIYCKEYSSLH